MTTPALRLVPDTPDSGPLPPGLHVTFSPRDPRDAAFVLALIAASPLKEHVAVRAFAARWMARRLGPV